MPALWLSLGFCAFQWRKTHLNCSLQKPKVTSAAAVPGEYLVTTAWSMSPWHGPLATLLKHLHELDFKCPSLLCSGKDTLNKGTLCRQDTRLWLCIPFVLMFIVNRTQPLSRWHFLLMCHSMTGSEGCISFPFLAHYKVGWTEGWRVLWLWFMHEEQRWMLSPSPDI